MSPEPREIVGGVSTGSGNVALEESDEALVERRRFGVLNDARCLETCIIIFSQNPWQKGFFPFTSYNAKESEGT